MACIRFSYFDVDSEQYTDKYLASIALYAQMNSIGLIPSDN